MVEWVHYLYRTKPAEKTLPSTTRKAELHATR